MKTATWWPNPYFPRPVGRGEPQLAPWDAQPCSPALTPSATPAESSAWTAVADRIQSSWNLHAESPPRLPLPSREVLSVPAAIYQRILYAHLARVFPPWPIPDDPFDDSAAQFYRR